MSLCFVFFKSQLMRSAVFYWRYPKVFESVASFLPRDWHQLTGQSGSVMLLFWERVSVDPVNMTVVLLNQLSDPDCRKLCHAVVDGICRRQQPQREEYSTTCSLDEWLELNKSLTSLMCLAAGSYSSDEEVLAGLSDVTHSDVVLSVLKARRHEICQALLDSTTSISSAVLTDFDWKLKLALSSDKISSLQTPLLSLSLDVREQGVLRPITMEMNREELNTLITSLEAANKVVLQLK